MIKLLLSITIILSSFSLLVGNASARPKMQTINYAINLNWCGHIKKFCAEGREAYRVAACETGNTFNIWATNGQYKGLWQMGSSERRRFGHAWNAWEQAKAAHKYYKIAGWRPWTCKWAA